MNRDNRIILIYRRSRLAELVARHNTPEQARFHVEHLGGDFEDYVDEDATQAHALQLAERELRQWGRVQCLERGFLPNYIFGPEDTVVVVGQDGLVANTMKYLDGQPVIALNPDPNRYEGVLLPFGLADLPSLLPEAVQHKLAAKSISLAHAKLSDGQELLAVNDFFIGPSRHTTASYALTHGPRSEQQMSSGVIVSTGLGSTGWLRSMISGAAGLATAAGKQLNLDNLLNRMHWDSDFLLYAVREPYLGRTSQAAMCFGLVDADNRLSLESCMGEEGVIFSDGMLDDAIAFQAGVHAEIGLARKQGRLAV